MEGTVEPLTRANRRELCYAARDAFFACLTTHNEDASACAQELSGYRATCMKSWVRYVVCVETRPCCGLDWDSHHSTHGRCLEQRRYFDGQRKAQLRKELARKKMNKPQKQ